ncbi:protochlorophyllide-dependent translocon component 52, chloroplastic [Melia azedarach]|uniref:Protochlorophyllide-dependent translocon component 52, chloroplastic n=1 Tax=Melia azedarach TaxID=155640 RepID=A0ACC1YM12_MELAZ|nr:protochlorophyllide-dependent translocon component 52, chloroplastic [Melia azedarach]
MPPREQQMNRYWTHVVHCSSCSPAHKTLNALEAILQLISVASIGIATATKQKAVPAAARTAFVSVVVACFAASKWLAHFIYKNFHYHDYNHALCGD